jgi:hypothetical protein
MEGSRVSCSYCGKLVGLMAIHLILLAINKVNPGLQGSVHIFLTALRLWIRSGTCLPQEFPQDWCTLMCLRIFWLTMTDFPLSASIPMFKPTRMTRLIIKIYCNLLSSMLIWISMPNKLLWICSQPICFISRPFPSNQCVSLLSCQRSQQIWDII